MWHSMFAPELPYAEKILRTVIVYALVAVLIRLAGKRSLAGLNTLDFVVMFLLSNVVQNAIIGPDNSITGAAVGAATLIVLDTLLNRLALGSHRLTALLDGTQSTVITDGKIDDPTARRLGLSRAELQRAVRIQNADDLAQVKNGTLFPGGELVLTLDKHEQGATKGDVEELRTALRRIERALGLDPAAAN